MTLIRPNSLSFAPEGILFNSSSDLVGIDLLRGDSPIDIPRCATKDLHFDRKVTLV
jgi:hypothetical protein